MGFNIFDVFKRLNEDDAKNKTRNLAISNHVLGARKTNKGAVVEMGCEEFVISNMAADESVFILLVIDRKEYAKVEREMIDAQNAACSD